MSVCPACGRENPEGFRFCGFCSAALTEATPERESRRTVSIVFCDVTGSTALGERLDPEALRHVMTRYYLTARGALERHGGTVEKFIGDAAVGIFGIPVVHEDDALRAVRAAAELRDDVAALNKELERDRGVAIQVRIGVHTGEVMAGASASGHALMSGDAGNVAARLEQAAAPGEVLLSEATHHLVRDALVAEDAGVLDLKGKAAGVHAFRVMSVGPAAAGHARRLDSPLVGRDRHLALLRQTYESAIAQGTCQLFTVLGPAGSGKSRLVEEFLAGLPGATILRGRCLSYGDGITFHPLAEVVAQAAGLSPSDDPTTELARIAALLDTDDRRGEVASTVAQMIGASGRGLPAIQEGYWATRRLFESIGERAPLALVLDDIHWAEPAFLDLLDHVADLSRGASILLLCMARPELLDDRPAWGGGKFNATSVLLEPLTDDESATLLQNLLGGAALPPEVRTRILETAEGNPLFVEETLAILVDDGLLVRDGNRWMPTGGADLSAALIPPSVQALLAARLDRCDPLERSVLGCAAVIGKVFYRGAVEDLGPDAERGGTAERLTALVRKGLIAPERSDLSGEEAYRFHHILFRDTCYASLGKEERADLHERAADWLGRRIGEGEADEFAGYHLGEAHRYRVELGLTGERTEALGRRAAERLLAAGKRARSRSDIGAAAKLLRRAASIRPEPDAETLLVLGDTIVDGGELGEGASILAEAARVAERQGDTLLAARARLRWRTTEQLTDPEGKTQLLLDEVGRCLVAFRQAGDDRGLATAYQARAEVHWMRCRNQDAHDDALLAAEHARAAGDPIAESMALCNVIAGSCLGLEPASVARRECDELAPRLMASEWFTPIASGLRAWVFLLEGDIEGARTELTAAYQGAERTGNWFAHGTAWSMGIAVELIAGEPERALEIGNRAYELFSGLGDVGHLSTCAAHIARALLALGRDDEAERYARECRELSASDDIINHWLWRAVQAQILARRGEPAEAERLAREAVAALDGTQLYDKGNALLDLGDVLAAIGKLAAARGAYERALDVWERKEFVPMIERTRRLLATLPTSG